MINEKSVMTLPYADDFYLITTNMRAHKRNIAEIHFHINSVGMSLTPSKRRYFFYCERKTNCGGFALVVLLLCIVYMKSQQISENLYFFKESPKILLNTSETN